MSEPTCQSCGKPWTGHPGCEELCREVERLKTWIEQKRKAEYAEKVKQRQNLTGFDLEGRRTKACYRRWWDAETKKILMGE